MSTLGNGKRVEKWFSEKEKLLRKLNTSFARKYTDDDPRSSTSSGPAESFASSSSFDPPGKNGNTSGWAASPQLPDGWSSRSTLNSCTSAETPITPISPHEEISPIDWETESGLPIMSTVGGVTQTLPIRSKPTNPDQAESCGAKPESSLLQPGNDSRWQESCPQTPVQRPLKITAATSSLPKLPITSQGGPIERNIEETGDQTQQLSRSTPSPIADGSTTDQILREVLATAFGVGDADVKYSMPRSRAVVRNFLSDLSWAIDNDDSGIRQAAGLNRFPTNGSKSSSGTQSSRQSSTRSDRGKRKCRGAKKDDQDDDDVEETGSGDRGEPSPSKRARIEPVVRLSCPYRKKNPLRFNVRDHRLCALTVFTDIAELRRHIQDCHKKPSPSPYLCLRCRVSFPTEDDLRQHQLYISGLCPIVQSGNSNNDPEDGIDQEIADKLRSKKGRVADPIEIQWQKMWNLLFPGTLVQPYEYCAVLEHFELHKKLQSTMPSLLKSLSQVGLSLRGVETLGSILSNHFIELLEECNHEARQKDYRNRQPKPQQSPSARLRPKQSSLKRRLGAAHRDSGVDVGYADNGYGLDQMGCASRDRSVEVSSSVQTTPLLYQAQASCLLEDIPEFMLSGCSGGLQATKMTEVGFSDESFGPSFHPGQDMPGFFPGNMAQECVARDLSTSRHLDPLAPPHPQSLQFDQTLMSNFNWDTYNGNGSSGMNSEAKDWS